MKIEKLKNQPEPKKTNGFQRKMQKQKSSIKGMCAKSMNKERSVFLMGNCGGGGTPHPLMVNIEMAFGQCRRPRFLNGVGIFGNMWGDCGSGFHWTFVTIYF